MDYGRQRGVPTILPREYLHKHSIKYFTLNFMILKMPRRGATLAPVSMCNTPHQGIIRNISIYVVFIYNALNCRGGVIIMDYGRQRGVPTILLREYLHKHSIKYFALNFMILKYLVGAPRWRPCQNLKIKHIYGMRLFYKRNISPMSYFIHERRRGVPTVPFIKLKICVFIT